MAASQKSKAVQDLRRAVLLRDGAGLTDGQLLGYFVESRDEDAFAALVRRHGPMVWGVCRRLLEHQDAEDACQATFLVLFRKAASIRPREMVANFLYGVAHQAALQARRAAARRRAREKQVKEMPEPASVERDLWEDLRPLLDQELSRLPDRYRAAIVLCDLEGKSRKEAALQLGLPEGTVASRLARARATLAKRLARHGLAVSGGALAAVLAEQAASASVPSSVVLPTLEGTGLLASGAVSVEVAALAEGVLRTMLLAKLKVVMLVLVFAALSGAAGLIYQTQAAGQVKIQQADESPRAVKKEDAIMREREKLQGTWEIVSGEQNGEELTEERAREAQVQVTIAGDRMTLTSPRRPGSLKATFTLDPATQPKTMKLTFEEQGGGTATLGGIYEVEGDTLKLCYGEEPPTEFRTKPDRQADQRLYVLRRKGK